MEITKSLLQSRAAKAASPDPAHSSLQFADGQFKLVASHPPGTPILALRPANEVLGIGFHVDPLASPVPLHESPALRNFANTLAANSEKGASLATLVSTTAAAIPANTYGIGEGLREVGDIGTMVFCTAKALDPATRHDKAQVAVNGLRVCIGTADLAAALGHFHGLGTTIQVLKILSDGVAAVQAFNAKQPGASILLSSPKSPSPQTT